MVQNSCVLCPECKQKAKRVSSTTVRAIVKQEYVGQIENSESQPCCSSENEREMGCHAVPRDSEWRYCYSPNCNLVYFSEHRDATFTKAQIKVVVGEKEPTGERPMCYCFGHSVASIKEEIRTRGQTLVLEDIRAKMKSIGCRCETENPSGKCCLGTVAKGVAKAHKELHTKDASEDTTLQVQCLPSSRGELFAKIGTVVSAILASACCWLPLVLLAVGVSGAGIAATLETYHPLFITVTIVFLSAAFYFTYRPRKLVQTEDNIHGCCGSQLAASPGCCADETRLCPSVKPLNKAMLWGVTLLSLGFMFFPSYVGVFLDHEAGTTITSNMNAVRFHVDGMTCEACASIVAKAIRDVSGVLAVEVDYEKREAFVGVERSYPIPKDQIVNALQQIGYKAFLIEDKGSSTVTSDAKSTAKSF